MISLFQHKDKKDKPVDKPVDYEKNPRYNQWKKVFEQAGDHVAKENHPKEHADFKQYYEQQTKKE